MMLETHEPHNKKIFLRFYGNVTFHSSTPVVLAIIYDTLQGVQSEHPTVRYYSQSSHRKGCSS